MRIVFLNYETALGSAVHATPVFSAVRGAHTDWEIHSISSGIASDVLNANPRFDKIWKSPHLVRDPVNAMKWLIANRNALGRFDQILFNTGNCRTKIVLGSRLIKAGRRMGFSIHPALVNLHLQEDPASSVIGNNLKLLGIWGIPLPAAPDPEVWFTAEDAEEARFWRHGLDTSGTGLPVVGYFSATSGGAPNQWFDERFIALANSLYKTTGATGVFFGGPQDVAHTAKLTAGCEGPAWPLAGKTTIRQLAARIAVCDLVVSVDTGGFHVAWAVGTPVVVLGNAAQPRHLWLPSGNAKVAIIRKDDKVPCAHCHRQFCATRECMDEISVEEAAHTACAHLEKFPPHIAAREARLSRWISGQSKGD